MTVTSAKDAGRDNVMRSKDLGELVLVHVARDVGDIKVGVLLVGELLEL